jgi:hypothetical protein
MLAVTLSLKLTFDVNLKSFSICCVNHLTQREMIALAWLESRKTKTEQKKKKKKPKPLLSWSKH